MASWSLPKEMRSDMVQDLGWRLGDFAGCRVGSSSNQASAGKGETGLLTLGRDRKIGRQKSRQLLSFRRKTGGRQRSLKELKSWDRIAGLGRVELNLLRLSGHPVNRDLPEDNGDRL